MNTKYSLSDWDSERLVDQLIRENDDQSMPCPIYDSEPDLLLSKVRQHYMKHVVKLLSVNYENNQRLLNKNIYLPSGIWRCAKLLEMRAAQRSMVIQLYRQEILAMIKEVKKDTEKGKLNRNLLDCLRSSPNEKKTQTVGTSVDPNCKCNCNDSKRRRKSAKQRVEELLALSHDNSGLISNPVQFKIPVALNMKTNTPEPFTNNNISLCRLDPVPLHHTAMADNYSVENMQQPSQINNMMTTTNNMTPINNIMAPSNMMTSTNTSTPIANTISSTITLGPNNNMMTPIHPGNDDDIMMQLEKLFHTEQTDDDLFDATFNKVEPAPINKPQNDLAIILQENINNQEPLPMKKVPPNNDLVIAAQIRSLDERLAALTGILVNNDANTPDTKEEKKTMNVPIDKPVKKRKFVSKWECEEYFQKKNLFEALYTIGDMNRRKLFRIKEKFLFIFGEDDDEDEEILSPMEDNPQIMSSCKTRISVSVLTTLTPYFLMGRIRGKNLFKSVVKHLIDLIFKCKQYPEEIEIVDFVKDFIRRHAIITCEADYMEIIDTVRQAPYVFA